MHGSEPNEPCSAWQHTHAPMWAPWHLSLRAVLVSSPHLQLPESDPYSHTRTSDATWDESKLPVHVSPGDTAESLLLACQHLLPRPVHRREAETACSNASYTLHQTHQAVLRLLLCPHPA